MSDEFSEESIDFLASIKADLEDLKKKEEMVKQIAEDAIKFINENNIFEKWQEFNVKLTMLQSTLTPFITRQMELEEKYLAIQQRMQEVQPQLQQQQPQESWWSKLAQRLGLKKTPLPAPSPTTVRTAGTDLENKIAYVRAQFDNHYWWYQFHEGEGNYALLMADVLYLSGLFSQIKTYVESAYEIQKDRYTQLREALNRAWIGSETIPVPAESKK